MASDTALKSGPPAWFPVMWADDSESSFLLTRSALRDTIIGAGFVAIEEDQARNAGQKH